MRADHARKLLAWGGGNPWGVSIYRSVLVLITVVSVGLTKETHKTGIGPEHSPDVRLSPSPGMPLSLPGIVPA